MAEASGLDRPNLRLTGEDSPSLMAVAMPSVERSFFFRVEGRLSLEALEGMGRLEVETPSLLEPEEEAAVGILDSAAALAAVLVFRGGITIFNFLLFKLCSLKNVWWRCQIDLR